MAGCSAVHLFGEPAEAGSHRGAHRRVVPVGCSPLVPLSTTHQPPAPPPPSQQVVIFVKSVARARELNRLLNECNFPSTTIHSAMRQEERLQVRG